jgi:hypothetical protein
MSVDARSVRGRGRRRAADGASMVPAAEPRSYYGRSVLKPPVWEDYIGWYLVVGGLGGASLTLAAGARLSGNNVLARRALFAGVAGLAASPPLLIADLGRPERFLNMLRVAKPTSPMSVGTWVLAAASACSGAAATSDVLGILRPAGRAAEVAGGALGAVAATYTAVLLADTAVPVWRDARRELPFVFAGSAAASAGAVASLLSPASAAAPARRLCVLGAAAEIAAAEVMRRRLGSVGAPLQEGLPGRLARAATVLSAGGALLLAAAGRRRPVAIPAAAAVLAGSACERFAIFRAGFASAADPGHTVGPQNARLAQRAGLSPE